VQITILTARARELAARALTTPPTEILDPATNLNREVFKLLQRHHKPAHARDLYTIAGATCVLLSLLAADLGALDAAAVHAATAQVCADHADRDELRAWVASARSKTAFWVGDYKTAAQTAHAGLSLEARGTAAVMLACQEADAYAKLGASDLAAAALDRATREADFAHGPDLIGGILSCGPVRLAGYTATANALAGKHGRALDAAEWALTQVEADPLAGFAIAAQLHVTRGIAYTAAGDLDGTAAALRPVLDLPTQRRLATITGRLQSVTWDLGVERVRTSAVARPLREEIIEYCGSGAHGAIVRSQHGGEHD
jgi:hypothetical protein